MVSVPLRDNLCIKDIIEFADRHVDIQEYLPELKDDKYPSRDFI